MSGRAVIVAVALALVAQPAWAQKVKTDFDKTVDFSAFKTYYWAKTDPGANDLMNQRIVAAVDHWFTVNGFTKVPEDQADLALAPHVSTQQGQTLNTFYDTWGGGWGYGGWGPGTATTTVDTYTEGTLIMDIFNAKDKKLVWRGTATSTISDNPEKVAKTIQKAAEKMFKKDFPPGVKQGS